MLIAVPLVLALSSSGASAAEFKELKRPSPDWYTQSLSERVLGVGAGGVRVAEEQLNLDCPGIVDRGVSASGCIVAPAGCTANNIFTDGASYYIGTARHCVDRGSAGGDDTGTPVVMQVDTTTIAEVGTVVKHTSGEGDPGNDFALIKLDPAVVSKWGVRPALPVVGGPNGVYTGCGATTVKHYGHGYGVAVAQGYPRAGLATNWLNDGYGWNGHLLPGDSGSAVVTGDGRSAGDLTHILVDFGDYLGSNAAGTRMTKILEFAGSSISLVNADGSTSRATATSC